ncbi:MAG: TetR/AcrR family transcriptional regulator [Solirubrobacterales bacterium]|nr:TetR/AcrR family transcriptional regulator [Solirubrobacterales bacterium]
MGALPDHFKSTPLGREQVSREVLTEHQREAVLVRVTAVFAKRGYQATTVDDLLAAGKVGVGNFYALFAGKEDCFLAAYDRIVDRAREHVSLVLAACEEWTERFYLGLRTVIEVMLAEPLEARLALLEAQSAGPVALARYNGLMDAAIEWLRGGREHCPPAKGLPGGFEQAAISGLAFYLQQCLLDSRRDEPGELFAEAAGLVLEPIVGAPQLRRLRELPAAQAL